MSRVLDSAGAVSFCVTVLLIGAASASPAQAQTPQAFAGAPGGLTVDGELENYLRYVESRDTAATIPWSLRRLTATQVSQVAARVDSSRANGLANPWSHSWLLQRESANGFKWLPVDASLRFNTTYPYGYNDGPIWAGKGATAALSVGFAARYGPLSITLDPMVFIAQNAAFTLAPNGQTGSLKYADSDFPTVIDRPQRFGNGTYSRFDPGESTIELDALGAAIGATTANQWWGPATTYPPIVGNNAPGVPSVFLGTNAPKNIWIGKLHARVYYGLETQSAFSPVVGPDTFVSPQLPGKKRFMSGLVAVYQPRWIPHLELGGSRYFHQAWTGHVTTDNLTTPFGGLLKSTSATEHNPNATPDAVKNQLGSVFFRWVLPHSGLDLYSEYAREDHNANSRDFEMEPDHSRFYMAGFRKAFTTDRGGLSALRIEYLDASEPSLGRHRSEGGVYTHTVLTQGHTEDGQLIGSAAGVGSFVGAEIAWDVFTPHGSTTWFVQRTSQNNRADLIATGLPDFSASMLAGTVGYNRAALKNASEVTYGLSLSDGKRGRALRPQLNLNATLSVRVR